MPRVICISDEFHQILKDRVIRDRKVLQAVKRKTKDNRYYPTFESATAALVPELKRLFK